PASTRSTGRSCRSTPIAPRAASALRSNRDGVAVDELIIASRAVHFVAAALMVGAPLFRLAIVPKGDAGGRAIEIAAALAALVSGLGWFAGVAATFTGSFADAVEPHMLQAIAFHTRFGHLWTARLVLLAVLLMVEMLGKSRLRDGALLVLAAA